MVHAVREAGSSYPGRDIIVEGVFSPTRQLVKFYSPEHDTYSKLRCHNFILFLKIVFPRYLTLLGCVNCSSLGE